MKPAIQVQKYSQSDEGFWELMGPMFASAELKKIMGVAMSSEESYTWMLASAGNNIVGFCAITPEKIGSRIRYVYAETEPVFTQLMGVAATLATAPVIRMEKASKAKKYDRFGLKPSGKTKGSYVELVKR